MINNNTQKWFLVLLYVLIIAAACTIPFAYESPSIFYKTGWDRFMLRTGKMAGIIAALLIMIQPVYVIRMKWFEKRFPLKKLFRYHKTGGLIILAAALIHPLLILGADHFVFFPLQAKYWPEFAGVVLFVLLSVFILMSHFQKKIGISYKIWKRLHRAGAPLIIVAVPVHAVNVSRSFESGPPFLGLMILAAAAGAMLIYKYLKR